MDEVLDNPAARLGYWLPQVESAADKVRDHRHGRRQKAGVPHSVRDTWAAVWNLDTDDPDQLLLLTDNGLTLIKEAVAVRKRATGSSSPFASHALEHFDQVERCVAYFLHMETVTIDVMMDPMEQGGWHSLGLLSTLLREEGREPIPDDEAREDLLKQTHDLMERVLKDANLDEVTKTQIMDALNDVQGALIRFKIGGAPVVEEASDRLAGSLVRSILIRGRDSLDHPITRGVLVLLNAISAAFGIPANYLALAQGFAGEIEAAE